MHRVWRSADDFGPFPQTRTPIEVRTGIRKAEGNAIVAAPAAARTRRTCYDGSGATRRRCDTATRAPGLSDKPERGRGEREWHARSGNCAARSSARTTIRETPFDLG